jgi:hypothetical protein
MIKSIRWGLTGLATLGCLAIGGAWMGCSSSSDNGTTTPEDTGVTEDTGTGTDSGSDTSTADTGMADTGMADTAMDTGGMDTAPPKADRKVTLIHAMPDQAASFFCLGAGAHNAAGGPPTSVALSVLAGSPDSTTPGDVA